MGKTMRESTDAREAIREVLDFWWGPMPKVESATKEVMSRLFAPSRVPCPTCGGRGVVTTYGSRGMDEYNDPCPNHGCSDGTIEGPSLAEQVLGFERADKVNGWLDGRSLVQVTPRRSEPVYRRRSSGSASTADA